MNDTAATAAEASSNTEVTTTATKIATTTVTWMNCALCQGKSTKKHANADDKLDRWKN